MINFGDIRDVHLEISSLCNASCPWCPRTFWGYPYNGGYPEANLSLAQATQIFQPEFLTQLKSIRINGTEPANPADREDTVDRDAYAEADAEAEADADAEALLL